MLHKVDLSEISDGKIYGRYDQVPVECDDCRGCCSCCQNMGTSVALDPYDFARLCHGLQKTPQKLMEDGYVDFTVNDGVFTPYLKMNEKRNCCSFLTKQGRCSIHAIRPGVCRLFPLGRMYQKDQIKYILQVDECQKKNRKLLNVAQWIGEKDMEGYEHFTLLWYQFTERFSNKVKAANHQDLMGEWNTVLLHLFYLQPYIGTTKEYNFNGFVIWFESRLAMAERVLFS